MIDLIRDCQSSIMDHHVRKIPLLRSSQSQAFTLLLGFDLHQFHSRIQVPELSCQNQKQSFHLSLYHHIVKQIHFTKTVILLLGIS